MIYVSAFRSKPRLYQQRAGLETLILSYTFQRKLQESWSSIHRVIFGFWRLRSICSIVVFKTLGSADNKRTFCKSLCSSNCL